MCDRVCGTCGSHLNTAGLCPICDYRRWTSLAVLDAELVVLLADCDLELTHVVKRRSWKEVA